MNHITTGYEHYTTDDLIKELKEQRVIGGEPSFKLQLEIEIRKQQEQGGDIGQTEKRRA